MPTESSTSHRLFAAAARFDPTLEPADTSARKLAGKRIQPTDYRRETLFANMADGRISVFSDYPSPLRTPALRRLAEPGETVVNAYLGSGIQRRIRVKQGPAKTTRYLSVPELASLWQRRRALMNVTDFHFRDTDLEQCIAPTRLSRFNLYPGCHPVVAEQEMMTLVVSSVGGSSDSHSDDSDGSNYCFTGQKLWLAWDTHEGLAAGLQDADRQDIYGTCRFDLDAWLSLRSARWFTVEDGQTLFMPGHLSHKVITLRPYLGVGSFYLALPNCLRTVSRWLLHGPNWEALERKGFPDILYPDVVERVRRKLTGLRRAGSTTRQQWGQDYLDYAAQAWRRQYRAPERELLMDSPYFRELKTLAG